MLIFFTISSLYLHSKNFSLKVVVLDQSTGEYIEKALVKADSLKSEFTNKSGEAKLSLTLNKIVHLEVFKNGYMAYHKDVVYDKEPNENLVIALMPTQYDIAPISIVANRHSGVLDNHQQILQGKELQSKLSQTVASTVKNEVSMAIRSLGPAPSRPVYRGLGGDRLQIISDGMNLSDLSATSNDHAVALNPNNAQSISIIKGPKLLLYSNSSIGASVNIENEDIPIHKIDNINIELNNTYESANNSYSKGAKLSIPYSNFILKSDYVGKVSEDVSSPIKILSNSSSSNMQYNVAGSYLGEDLIIGGNFGQYELSYGIPGGFEGGHPNGVSINMNKNSYNAKGIYHFHSNDHFWLDDAEISYRRTYYNHNEYESNGKLGSGFSFIDNNIYINFNVHPLEYESIDATNKISFGFNYNQRDNWYRGFVKTPSSVKDDFACFLVSEINSPAFEIQYGFRLFQSFYMPDKEKESSIGSIRNKSLFGYSTSFSILYKFTTNFSLGVNLAKASRLPTVEELYSEGPHLASYSYDTGNPSLSLENGFNFELFTNYKDEVIDIYTNVYLIDYSQFITTRNSGKIYYALILPIFSSQEVEALLYGFESKVLVNISETFSINSAFSLNRGINQSDKKWLAMMPPVKLSLEPKVKIGNLSLGIRVDLVDSQKQIDEFETVTPSYTTVNLYSQYLLNISDTVLNLSLSIDNMFNRLYYNHLSRIKQIMPEPGRNIRFNARLYL